MKGGQLELLSQEDGSFGHQNFLEKERCFFLLKSKDGRRNTLMSGIITT